VSQLLSSVCIKLLIELLWISTGTKAGMGVAHCVAWIAIGEIEAAAGC
jgi:hypothetical protein